MALGWRVVARDCASRPTAFSRRGVRRSQGNGNPSIASWLASSKPDRPRTGFWLVRLRRLRDPSHQSSRTGSTQFPSCGYLGRQHNLESLHEGEHPQLAAKFLPMQSTDQAEVGLDFCRVHCGLERRRRFAQACCAACPSPAQFSAKFQAQGRSSDKRPLPRFQKLAPTRSHPHKTCENGLDCRYLG